jgi:hypothetical protein
MQQQHKLHFTEQLRDRQARILKLDSYLRQFNVAHIKTKCVEEVKQFIDKINEEFLTLKQISGQKIEFCRNTIEEHSVQQEKYLDLSNTVNPKKFKDRVQKSIKLIQNEQISHLQSNDSLKEKQANLSNLLLQLEDDLESEALRNHLLKQKLVKRQHKQSFLREQIALKEEKILRLQNMTINIALDPSAAIQKISNPIL